MHTAASNVLVGLTLLRFEIKTSFGPCCWQHDVPYSSVCDNDSGKNIRNWADSKPGWMPVCLRGRVQKQNNSRSALWVRTIVPDWTSLLVRRRWFGFVGVIWVKWNVPFVGRFHNVLVPGLVERHAKDTPLHEVLTVVISQAISFLAQFLSCLANRFLNRKNSVSLDVHFVQWCCEVNRFFQDTLSVWVPDDGDFVVLGINVCHQGVASWVNQGFVPDDVISDRQRVNGGDCLVVNSHRTGQGLAYQVSEGLTNKPSGQTNNSPSNNTPYEDADRCSQTRTSYGANGSTHVGSQQRSSNAEPCAQKRLG